MFNDDKLKSKMYSLIRSTFQLGDNKCSCCRKSIQLKSSFTVLRYTDNKDECGRWYYCRECFDSVDEVLVEILTDSYPYGIYPLDKNKKILASLFPDWAPEVPIEKSNSDIEYFNFTADGGLVKKRKK